MNLRTYRAYTLQQALDAVREDLGPGAVILRTTTARQGGFMGLGARTIVEVTASDAVEPPVFRATPPKPRPRPRPAARPKAGDRDEAGEARREPMPAGPAARRNSAADASRPPAAEMAEMAEAMPTAGSTVESTAAAAPSPTPRPPVAAEPPVLDLDAERRRTRALARRMLADHERRARERAARDAEPARSPAAVTEGPVAEAPVTMPSPPATSEPSSVPSPSAIATPPGDEPAAAAAVPAPAAPAPSAAPAERSFPVADAAGDGSGGRVGRPPTRVRDEELEAIGGLVGEVLRGRHRRGPVPPEFFTRELALLAGEMSREFAESVIDEAMASLGGDAIDASEMEPAAAAAVHRRLAALVPIAEEALPARSPDARPLTVAFVGPTGVGKTTSIAKLAAALRLRHRLNVGLITADTYRIAAVDQLRTYADIIGVPLRVAMDARAMRQATLELADRDVILIDTAGRSQRDERRIDELRDMVEAADPHEVHLVLSAIAGARALRREAAAFSAVGTRKLVLTKLDEAVSFGMLIEAVAGIGLPLSFLTTGQEVPDDLERATAARLADLALEDVSAAAAAAAASGDGAGSRADRPLDGGRR